MDKKAIAKEVATAALNAGFKAAEDKGINVDSLDGVEVMVIGIGATLVSLCMAAGVDPLVAMIGLMAQFEK